MKRKAMCLLVLLLLLRAGMPVPAAAYESAYLDHAHFHALRQTQANAKYANGEKFILYCYRESCENSRNIGSTTVTSWMDDDGADVFGVDVDAEMPDFVWLYFSGSQALPMVLFIDGQTASAHSLSMYASVSEMKKALTKEYDAFTGQRARTVAAVSVLSLPDKTQYLVGESLDTSGLKIRIAYTNGTNAIALGGFACTGFSSAAAGEKTVSVSVGGKRTSFTVTVSDSTKTTVYAFSAAYRQTEARTMLAQLNALRTGSDAWYWNADNATKTVCSGLKPLVYDYELEQVAMQRAAEIVISFSHTRPNGKRCYSAFVGRYDMAGENIAYGYSTAAGAQTALEEANDAYAGQGHRRNMLNAQVTAVGLACVEYSGKKYWVQEFRNPASGAPAAAPFDGTKQVAVEILDASVGSVKLSADYTSRTLNVGDKAALPAVVRTIRLLTVPKNDVVCAADPVWTCSNPAAAAVRGRNIVAVGIGDATVTGTVGGAKVSIALTVTAASTQIPGDANDDGRITLKDAAMIARCLQGAKGVRVDNANADVNGDASVTAQDAALLKRFLVGDRKVRLH